MPRPSPLARAMDALALLLGLPDWDREERRVILHEVRPRLASISDLASRALEMDGLGQRIALRTIGKLARECVALVDAWAEGDEEENRCHRDGIAQLRLVCGGLDRGSHE